MTPIEDPPVVNGVYYIQNASNGKVLALELDRHGDNAKIVCQKKVALSDPKIPTQMWVIVKINPESENSIYKFLNASGGFYISRLRDDDTPVGVKAKADSNRDAINERWKIIPGEDDINYVLHDEDSTVCMEIRGNKASGGHVRISDEPDETKEDKHQLWNLVHI